MDSNPLCIGFEFEFQKVKKIEKGEKDSNPFVEDSNLQGKISNKNSKSTLQQRRTFLSMFQTFSGLIYFDKNEDKVQIN